MSQEMETGLYPVDRDGVWLASLPDGSIRDVDASGVLFVGSPGAVPEMAAFVSLSPIGPLPPSDAARKIRCTEALAAVWLSAADGLDEAMLADICAAASEQGCGIVCETSLAALDRIMAILPASLPVQFLVNADPTDRAIALAAVRRVRHRGLHDIARDEAMERIDRLQEEVARISRLLNELVGQRGGLAGTPTSAASRPDDFATHAEQVRSPVRDYAAIPRSFFPEGRMIDRQRAKAVRRMLRQRRMREQYFPADLFADPAWDMLLDLYAARLERQPVSVSSLCIAAAVPATTALRWIKTMTEAGLFVREDDPRDGRRMFIALAEDSCDALARYFDALEEQDSTVG